MVFSELTRRFRPSFSVSRRATRVRQVKARRHNRKWRRKSIGIAQNGLGNGHSSFTVVNLGADDGDCYGVLA